MFGILVRIETPGITQQQLDGIVSKIGKKIFNKLSQRKLKNLNTNLIKSLLHHSKLLDSISYCPVCEAVIGAEDTIKEQNSYQLCCVYYFNRKISSLRPHVSVKYQGRQGLHLAVKEKDHLEFTMLEKATEHYCNIFPKEPC